MDKMSFVSILAVSWPESLVFTVIILLTIGRKDLLNFKQHSNIIKFLVVSSLMTSIPVVTRHYSEYFISNQAVQSLLAITLFIIIYKIEWYNSLVGFFINIIACTIIELVSVLMFSQITGIPYQSMYTDDITRIMFSVPPRLLQITFAIVLYKLPFTLIAIKAVKITVDFLKKILMIITKLALCLIQVFLVVKHFIIDSPITKRTVAEMNFMMCIIIVTVILSIMIIVSAVKSSKKIELEKNEKLNVLMLIKTLLEGSESDKINKGELLEIVKGAIRHGR